MNSTVVGIDEAGRGPLAGPLVVVAVYGKANELDFCVDSKTISARKRQELLVKIQARAHNIGIGWVDASEIDNIGMSRALKLGTNRAFSSMSHLNAAIVIDGPVNFLSDTPKSMAVVKADQFIPQVSAASIVAKVFRDRLMTNLARRYPQWEFEKHKGYGTKRHKNLLKQHGPSPVHRTSFKGVLSQNEKHYP